MKSAADGISNADGLSYLVRLSDDSRAGISAVCDERVLHDESGLADLAGDGGGAGIEASHGGDAGGVGGMKKASTLLLCAAPALIFSRRCISASARWPYQTAACTSRSSCSRSRSRSGLSSRPHRAPPRRLPRLLRVT